VDWTTLQAPADWARLGDNNVSFTSLIEDEVLAKGRRALVVLGSNHLMRTGARDGGPNTTTRVEERFPGSIYVIWLYTGRPGSDEANARMARENWHIPSVHPLAGAWLGAIPAAGRRFQDLADAVLYLGPPDSLRVAQFPVASFDVDYRRELERRSWIEWGDSSRARRFLALSEVPAGGTVTEFQVPLTSPDGPRTVWVYQPAGYPATCPAACDLLVAFDGGEYVTTMRLPQILDSLIAAHSIGPTVALLIENGSSTSRLADLANHAHFASVVADQLIPWLRGRWRVTNDPRRITVTGSSAGGLAAAYLAFVRPDVFGNVVSQSGAFWRGNEGTDAPPYEWLTTRYAEAPPRGPIRFFLDVGSTESGGALGGRAPSILEANRRLRTVLVGKGYKVEYMEVPGGQHDPESWQVRLPIGLAAMSAAGPEN
jgi:enterochelin esterase family protein